MYIKDILGRSKRSLLSAKARTILTALALAVGAFALTLTLAASNGAQSYVNKLVNDNFDPAVLLVSKDTSLFSASDNSKPQEYDPSYGAVIGATGESTSIRRLNDGDISAILAIPDVESVRAASSVSLKYITSPGQRKYIATLSSLNPAQKLDILAGSSSGSLKPGNVIIPDSFVSSLGFKNPAEAINKKVTVVVQQQLDQSLITQLLAQPSSANVTSSGTRTDTMVIVAVAKKPAALLGNSVLNIYANDQQINRLNDYINQGTANYHQYISVNVRVKDGTSNAKLKATQAAIKRAGYGALSVQDTQKFLTQIINVLQGIVTAFGFIAVVASVFGIVNTMYISVLQRTREIGLMKALGMSGKDISRLFRFEASLLGLLGGVLGSAVAVIAGTLLNPWISNKLGIEGQHILIFKYNQILLLVVVLMLVGTFAGLLPARKAAKLNPIDALRTE